MVDTSEAINSVARISQSIGQLSSTVQSGVGQIGASIGQAMASAQSSFAQLLKSAAGSTAAFSTQFLSLAGVGTTLGLAKTLEEINGQLTVLNETMGATKDGAGSFFDGLVTGTGFVSDLTTAMLNLTEATNMCELGNKALKAAQKLLNNEHLISIGNWIKETAATATHTVAMWAQHAVLTAYNAVQKLFNAETWISIGNWIKETTATAAHTVATWAQHAALTAYNVVQKLFNAEIWTSIGNWIQETAATAAHTVAMGAQQAITGLVTAAQTALNFVMNMNPIALIVIAITALVAAFALLWTKCEGFRNFMTGFFKNVASGFISLVNLLIQGINMLMEAVLLPINLIIKGLNLIPGISIPVLVFAIPQIPTFADGGFPSMGQMFIAREAGPELVGRIGSRTAVANNDQIVAGISQGVRGANEDVINVVYTAARQIVNAINRNGGDIYLDGEKVGSRTTQIQDRQNRMYGKCLQNV